MCTLAMHRFFFFMDSATTQLYTLSLHDALPISLAGHTGIDPYSTTVSDTYQDLFGEGSFTGKGDRKSTRLNSSHVAISYAVFCLKKQKATSQHSRLLRVASRLNQL